MITLATDLDRTLFPNGQQEYDNSMPVFKRIIEEKSFGLIYVTGRNTDQIEKGMQAYAPPLPSHAIAEVGTKIYSYQDGSFLLEEGYRSHIQQNTRNWNRDAIEEALLEFSWLRLQEEHNQNEFKVSFYADTPENLHEKHGEIEEHVQAVTPDAALTVSVDETKNLGLLDVMPKSANKMEGIEYLRKKLNIPKEEVIYCGDSGNDLVPLAAGYRAILVRNATAKVRERLQEMARSNGVEDYIYYAEGMDTLNGNYVSGIVEGLLRFDFITADDIKS